MAGAGWAGASGSLPCTSSTQSSCPAARSPLVAAPPTYAGSPVKAAVFAGLTQGRDCPWGREHRSLGRFGVGLSAPRTAAPWPAVDVILQAPFPGWTSDAPGCSRRAESRSAGDRTLRSSRSPNSPAGLDPEHSPKRISGFSGKVFLFVLSPSLDGLFRHTVWGTTPAYHSLRGTTSHQSRPVAQGEKEGWRGRSEESPCPSFWR